MQKLRLLVCVAGLAGSLAGCMVEDVPDEGPLSSSPDSKADGTTQFVVNGYELTDGQQLWMQYIADRVIPELAGTRERRIQIAARTAWWSLKEGIFDATNPPLYSNCHGSSGDHLIGPLSICGSGRAWQVGLAAVQVPNVELADVETLATEIYPAQSLQNVLAEAAAEAGFDASSNTSQAIVRSSGSLRKSWLLRNSAIGFTVCERGEVVPECITGSKGWCYGTGWTSTRRYAPSKTAALRSMRDISALLGRLVR